MRSLGSKRAICSHPKVLVLDDLACSPRIVQSKVRGRGTRVHNGVEARALSRKKETPIINAGSLCWNTKSAVTYDHRLKKIGLSLRSR
jgi:hypothetical protein